MFGWPIRITTAQYREAAHEGIERRIRAIEGHHRPGNGHSEPNEIQIDCSGAIGELVFALAFDEEWDAWGRRGGTDVGGMQVRTTGWDQGCLPLQPRDADDELFWLVTGKGLDYTIRGCVLGWDGKRPPMGTWASKGQTKRPCWWVAQHSLCWPEWAIERVMEVNHGRSTHGLFASV